MPESVINEYMALNVISPFIYDAQSYREGLIATLLYNNNITKKSDSKSVSDLFPYLSNDIPEYLEDERIIKAKALMKSIRCHTITKTYQKSYDSVSKAIREEIQIEKKKNKPDIYVISKLEDIIN